MVKNVIKLELHTMPFITNPINVKKDLLLVYKIKYKTFYEEIYYKYRMEIEENFLLTNMERLKRLKKMKKMCF